MPYWTPEQESKLKGMASQGKSLEEPAENFNRTAEAVLTKLKRSLTEPKNFFLTLILG